MKKIYLSVALLWITSGTIQAMDSNETASIQSDTQLAEPQQVLPVEYDSDGEEIPNTHGKFHEAVATALNRNQLATARSTFSRWANFFKTGNNAVGTQAIAGATLLDNMRERILEYAQFNGQAHKPHFKGMEDTVAKIEELVRQANNQQ